MPSIGDARLVDGALGSSSFRGWEVFLGEWTPYDGLILPPGAVGKAIDETGPKLILRDEQGVWRDLAGELAERSGGEPQERAGVVEDSSVDAEVRRFEQRATEEHPSGADDFWASAVAALVSTAKTTASIEGRPDWEPDAQERAELRSFAQTYSSDDAHRAAQNLAIRSILPEMEAAALESAIAEFETWAGRPPTPGELGTIRKHLANKTLTPIQRATMVKNLAQSLAPEDPEVYPTEEILTGPEAMALGAGEGQQALVLRNPDGSIRNIVLQDAPEPYFETERRREEARRATEIAKKTRSAEEQFDAALDAGDLDKARLIRNFLDEPSEWQIELLKMEYADNLPALKILFDYVDAIGRADVVPGDARALVEPTPPQPATPSERQKMVDPVGWAAAQPPGTFQTQGPPGFGGETPAFVGDEVFPDTPAAALRRGDPNLFFPGGAQLGAEAAGDGTFRGPVGPVPSTRRLSATDMASPLFQSSLQTAKGTADEPVVHLLVDGIHTPVLASQYAGFVRQATSLGRTVEVPNRDTGVFDTVGADGSIQSRPTVEDDGSVRFGPTGERFVTEKTLTADQVTAPLFQQEGGVGGVQPLAPFSWSQAEKGRPEGLPFTVTPETMDKIQRARDIDLSRSEPDYGSVTFVKPGGLSAEESRYITDTVTAEIETSARNSRNRAFYLREQARNYPVSFPMTTIGSPPRTYSYGDQLLQEADELEARAAEREKNAATEIRERLAEASKGQMGSSSWSTEADIEEFKKQRPGWVEAYRTDPLPVAEPVFGPSRAEREATFIREAQAFAPQKKTPRSFGPPRFVTT